MAMRTVIISNASNPERPEVAPNTTTTTCSSSSSSRLYLDILELILHEHRNDVVTLANCALASHALLHIARKFLYRAVSLDYCENPYAYDQQRLLRFSLASHPHLCRLVRTLRLSLSLDPLVTVVLENLTRVEKLHVVGGGGGGGGGGVGETGAGAGAGQNQYYGNPGMEGALRRVFGLPSLRAVTLENVFPFSGVYVSCFSALKQLELVSVEPVVSIVPSSDDPPPAPAPGPSEEALGGAAGFSPSPMSFLASKQSRRRVCLEYLTLNLDRFKPIMDIISQDADAESESVLDFSHLKQAHIYVWDPDDGDGIWALLHCARNTLEHITLRYFQYSEPFASLHTGFHNLESILLGTPTFSIKEDPFRGLILFFTPSKLPSLRKLKISFDLWGCESGQTTWKDVCGYRGWRELDRSLSAFPDLASVVFEILCSARYKGGGRKEDELECRSLLLQELPNLQLNSNFLLI